MLHHYIFILTTYDSSDAYSKLHNYLDVNFTCTYRDKLYNNTD